MVTEDRDLRAGTSLWQAQSRPRLRKDRLRQTDRFDVAVIGTGISGALVSDALLASGLSVVAVDRRAPMTGSTPASTALLQFELDTPLRQLRRKVGAKRAERAWLRSAQAVQALGNRIRDLGIGCDWRDRSTIYLPGDVLDVAGLRHETRERQRLNLRSHFVNRTELKRMSGISAAGAIVSHGNAEANPLKLTAALWRSFQRRGGKVISPFEVDEVKA
jgi:glycine/D-amino acid oxidase-like deaminating enzyme